MKKYIAARAGFIGDCVRSEIDMAALYGCTLRNQDR